MFDFTNSTFSALLTILSMLFGVAYPLILGCIEKIDSKYNSTVLLDRFKKESSFQIFKILLPVNLIVAIVFAFILDGSVNSRLFISGQAVLVLVQGLIALSLFSRIFVYYNVLDLSEDILDEYRGYKKHNKKEEEKQSFLAWADLANTLQSSSNDKILDSIRTVLEQYVEQFSLEHDEAYYEYDQYFYLALTRINEVLCKGEFSSSIINNSNFIMTDLIYNELKISKSSYTYLWKILRTQLQYHKYNWIIRYWEAACSKHMIIKCREDNNSKEQMQEMADFKEFHIMLCALLLQQKEYSTLQQLLSYTTSIPESYPLVPSNFAEILKWFSKFTQKADDNPWYLENRYPMPNMNGITIGRILGSIYCYLTLLIYRLYSLVWYEDPYYILNYAIIPNSLKELRNLDDDLNALLYWIGKKESDKELMAVIGIDDFQIHLDKLRSRNDKSIESPKALILSLKDAIEAKQHKTKEEQEYDKEGVLSLFSQIEENILEKIKPLSDFIKSSKQDEKFSLNSSSSHLFPSEAFLSNPSISYVDIESYISGHTLNMFYHFFASIFYVQYKCKPYNLYSSDLFKALDKLAIGKNFVIIIFNVYLDYFLEKIDDFEKVKDFTYSYKGIKILNLPCNKSIFSQKAYVMHIKDMPTLSFRGLPKKEDKPGIVRNIENSSHIGLTLRRAQKEDVKEKDTEDFSELSVLSVEWYPELSLNKNVDVVRFNIKYKGYDEGTCVYVDDISPFPTNNNK